MSSQSDRNYASAVQDTNVSLPPTSNDATFSTTQDSTAMHPVSPTRAVPLNISSSISNSPKTPPRTPLASSIDHDSTHLSIEAPGILNSDSTDNNKLDIFYDAPDTDLVIESSNSALWVPADFHPEIDPEMFKAHVKLTVDEIMLRNLKRKSMLSCSSTGSSPTLASSHSRSGSNSPIKSTDVSPEKELLPSSSRRLSATTSRYSTPSLRELTSELEILSQRAGMDANDTVTLARTLSRSSLGYTDVELLAMDELQSPQSLTLHLPIYVDEVDTRPIQASVVDVESPTRYKTLGRIHETSGPLQNNRRPISGVNQDFGHPLEGSEASQAFALRRNRRPNFRKTSTALGSSLQSSKYGKLAELRSELSSDYGGGMSATSPLPQRRRDPAARKSHNMFSYREMVGRVNPEASRAVPKHLHQQEDFKDSQDESGVAHDCPLYNNAMAAHSRQSPREPSNTHGRPHQSDVRSFSSHGVSLGPYAMASRSSPSLVITPRHESSTPRSRLSYAIDSLGQTTQYHEPVTPKPRQSHATGLLGQPTYHHGTAVQGQPNYHSSTPIRTPQHDRSHVPQAPTTGAQLSNSQPRHPQPHQNMSQSPQHAAHYANDYSMNMRPYPNELSQRSYSLTDAALRPAADLNQRDPHPLVLHRNPIRTPIQAAPLPGVPNSVPSPAERESQFVIKQSHKLNQNLDLLRSELNDFKERLTKTEAPPPNANASAYTNPVSPTDSATDFSFDVSEPDVAGETSFDIQPYLGEPSLKPSTSNAGSKAPVSPGADPLVVDDDDLDKVPDFVDFEDSTSHISSDGDFDPSQFTGTLSPIVNDFSDAQGAVDVSVPDERRDDDLPALEGKPSMESVHEDSDVASLETSPTKPRKRFGNMPNNVAKIHREETNGPPAKSVKKKKSWMWLKDRSVSLDENSLSSESLRPSSRLVSTPAFSSNATKPLKVTSEPAEKAVKPRENMLSKLFKKKKAVVDAAPAVEAQPTSEDIVKTLKERKSEGALKSMKEKRSEGALKSIRERKSEGTLQPIKEKKSEGVMKPLKEKRSRLFGNKKTLKDQVSVGANDRSQPKASPAATIITADDNKENPSMNIIDASRPSLRKSTSQVNLASTLDDDAVAAIAQEPKSGNVQMEEAELTTVSTNSDEGDPEEVLLCASEVQDKLKKSIRRTSKANQPLEFTDSAFGFPLPPPSPSTLIMIDYRFPLHVERAIYRLSHLKLANPKRSLREQVLLSNFMYAYLNLVDHTLHIEQQMEKAPEDAPETVTLKKTDASVQPLTDTLTDTLKGLTDSDFGEEGMAEDEDFDDVMDGAYKSSFMATTGPASLV